MLSTCNTGIDLSRPFDGAPSMNPQVSAIFSSYSPAVRTALHRLRLLIFDVAAGTAGVGPLLETVKWGQPSYLPRTPRTGTTIRALSSMRVRRPMTS